MNGWDKQRLVVRLVLTVFLGYRRRAAVAPARAETSGSRTRAMRSRWIRIRSMSRCNSASPATSTSLVRVQNLELVRGWPPTEADVADRMGFNLRKMSCSTTARPSPRRRDFFLSARARRRFRRQTLRQEITEVRKSTTPRSMSSPRRHFRSCRRDFALVHHEQEVVRRKPRRRAGRQAQGHRNTASFRANGTDRSACVRATPHPYDDGAQLQLLGQEDRHQRRRSDIYAIGNASTRVAALLSGEIDMMEPVPVQDISRIGSNPASRCCRDRSCARSSSAWIRSAMNCCSRA